MTQILYAVFQENAGLGVLQGLVTSPEAALRWVHELQKIYQLTHFGTITLTSSEGEFLRWEALYGSWEIRSFPILEAPPVLEIPEPVLLTLRLRDQVNPNAGIEDLPPELQEGARAEQEVVGSNSIAMGLDEEVGWFVLHMDPELVYVIDMERGPGVTED